MPCFYKSVTSLDTERFSPTFVPHLRVGLRIWSRKNSPHADYSLLPETMGPGHHTERRAAEMPLGRFIERNKSTEPLDGQRVVPPNRRSNRAARCFRCSKQDMGRSLGHMGSANLPAGPRTITEIRRSEVNGFSSRPIGSSWSPRSSLRVSPPCKGYWMIEHKLACARRVLKQWCSFSIVPADQLGVGIIAMQRRSSWKPMIVPHGHRPETATSARTKRPPFPAFEGRAEQR